jgi:hypothetical protein
MKTLVIRRPSATFAALVLAFTSFLSAHAQASYRGGSLKVPFAFEFGLHQFAAGEYNVTHAGDNIIFISNGTATGASMILSSIDQDAARQNKLVFDKVGSQYFLRQIYSAGRSVHAEFGVSKLEKQALGKQMAANRVGPENIEVATR